MGKLRALKQYLRVEDALRREPVTQDSMSVDASVVSIYADWFSWNTQRPQHLVNYLSSLGVCTDVFSLRTVRSRRPVLGTPNRVISSCLYPRVLTRLDTVRDWNASKHQAVLDGFFGSEADCQIFASTPVMPTWKRRDCVRIYDCLDDHDNFPWVTGARRTAVAQYERSLGEWADRIWVVSRRLEEKLSPLFGRKIEYIPNGVDYEHFQRVPQLRPVGPKGRPRLGYIGTLHNWFDAALVRGVADVLKNWRIVLVGPNFLSSEELRLLGAANIQYAGRISYDRLPEFMATLDVAMIPFKLTKLIEATNPVKLYEYLASGVPVVATPMPEVVPFAETGVVVCRETVEGFSDAVLDLASSHRPARCQEIAKLHSWAARFEKPFADIASVRVGARQKEIGRRNAPPRFSSRKV